MRLLLTNINTLVQVESGTHRRQKVYGAEMAALPCLENAWLYAENGIIHSFGTMDQLPEGLSADEVINAEGRVVLPTWCDSHTHLVFAAPREQEFMDRIKGLSYEEIARRGGGILNSAKKAECHG